MHCDAPWKHFQQEKDQQDKALHWVDRVETTPSREGGVGTERELLSLPESEVGPRRTELWEYNCLADQYPGSHGTPDTHVIHGPSQGGLPHL